MSSSRTTMFTWDVQFPKRLRKSEKTREGQKVRAGGWQQLFNTDGVINSAARDTRRRNQRVIETTGERARTTKVRLSEWFNRQGRSNPHMTMETRKHRMSPGVTPVLYVYLWKVHFTQLPAKCANADWSSHVKRKSQKTTVKWIPLKRTGTKYCQTNKTKKSRGIRAALSG